MPALSLAVLAALLGPTAVEARRGLGSKCGSRRWNKCHSRYSCQRSPVVKRCVPKSSTYASGSRGKGQSCYDDSDCVQGPLGGTASDAVRSYLRCEQTDGLLDRPHKRRCLEKRLVDVTGMSHGDVFRCSPEPDGAIGGTLIKAASRHKARNKKYVGYWTAHGERMCGVSESLTCGWDPSDGGYGGTEGYSTQCLGVCGPHCGEDGEGEGDTRWETLIVHDMCQSWIGSTEDWMDGGKENECGDEGSHSKGEAIKEWFKPGEGCYREGDFEQSIETSHNCQQIKILNIP